MSLFSKMKHVGLGILAAALFLTATPHAVAQSADAMQAGSASARSLVTIPVDAAQTVELSGSLPSFVVGVHDLGVVDSAKQISGVQIMLRRSTEQQQALRQLQKNGGVADLSPALFNETFGISRGDIQAVEAWLASNGLHVDAVKDGGRILVISGEAANFEAAFQTEMHNFASADGISFFANKSGLNVPAALQPVISKVAGLQNYHAEGALALVGPVTARKGFQPNLSQTQYAAANTTVGTTSATVTATLTYTASSINQGLATVKTINVLSQGQTGLDFAFVSGGTCATGVYYTAGTSCTVKFSFTPKYPGQRLGAIEMINSSGAIVAESFINGVGVSGQGEFTVGALSTVSSSLNLPRGVSVDISGNVYLADSGSGNIYKYTNGTGTPLLLASGFTNPTATAVDGAGNVFIASQQNNAIYEVVNGSMATTTQTPISVAAVTNPDDSMVVDGAGNVYFASCPSSANEPYCSSQLNVMAAGTHTLTTLIAAGSSIPGITGATFGRIIGMSIDYSGNLYLADFTNNRIYKMAAGTTTLSVLINQDGNLNQPHGIVVDGAGDMYVTNYDGNPYLLRYAPSGSGYVESTFSTAISSVGIAEDQTGNFFMLTGATTGTGALYKFTRATTPVLTFPSTQVGTSSAQQIVQFENDGNAALSITLLSGNNGNFNGAGTTCSTSTALGVGASCNLGVEFAPTSISSNLAGTAVITDNTLAATGTQQTVQISGPSYGLSSTVLQMSTNPTSVTYGQGTSVSYFAFVQGTPGGGQPTGTVTFTSSVFATSPQTATIASNNCSTTGSGATLVYKCGTVYTGNVPVATPAGNYTYTATYNGDTVYAGSTNSSTFTINGLAPSMAMVSAVATTYGSTTAVTVTATEAGSYGTVSGGVVTFSVAGSATGSFSPATCTLSAAGTCSTSFIPTGSLTAGTYANDIVASFAVNNNYSAASATNTLTVNKNAGATFGSMTFSPTSVAYGSSTAVTITDSLSYTGGGAAPSGQVTFVLNGVTYTATCTGSSSPLSCSATVPAATVAALAANSYTVTAALAADTNYPASTGTSGSFAVTAQTPTLSAITVSPASVQYGTSTPVTLSETVSYNGSSVPPGPMTFTLNGVNYTGTCTGTSSPLTCTATVPAATVAALAIKGYTVSSSFAGTGNFAPATGSGSFTVTLATATFGTMVMSPTSAVYGSSTPVTITDTLAYTSSVAPTGAVTFTTFGVAYTATCTGSSSPLTCSATVPGSAVAAAAVNTYSFAPAYAGNSYYSPATGAAGTFNITAQTPVLSGITASPSQVGAGSSTAVTLSETVTFTGSTAPTGPMTFTLNGVNYTATCTGSTSPLTCTYTVPAATIAALSAKAYAITSSFAAAGGFATATGTGSFTVNAAPTFGTVTFSPVSTVPYGTSQAITVSVPLNYSGTAVPTGTVTIYGDYQTYTMACTGSSSPLACSVTIPASTVHIANPGTYPFTPTLAADSYYPTATGAPSNFIVTLGNLTFGTATTFSPAASEAFGTSQAITVSNTLSYIGVANPSGYVYFNFNGTAYQATCTGSASPQTCTATIPASVVAGLNVGSYPGTWQDNGDGYYLATTVSQANSFAITQAASALTLVASSYGTTTAGVTSTTLTATSSPIRAGVTVTFTDVTTGAVLGTAVTNASGVATLAVSTSTTGIAAGMNKFAASFPGTTNYAAAASANQTVYVQGLLLSTDLIHDFSTAVGTYDNSPVCTGSNGTAGSTCTNSFGLQVTNFTSTTQVVALTFNNSSAKAFSYATNCSANGLAPGKTCNYLFYYLPPFGDGCNLATTCTTPAGQPSPEGTYEQATWSLGSTTAGVITGIGDLAFDRSGATSFPAILDGKALIAAGNAIAMTPQTLTFGPQAPGYTSATQNIFVTNTSPASVGVTYTLPSAPFTVVANNCAATLAAGATCQIQVNYTSSTTGTQTATLKATPSAGSVVTANLSGTTATNGGLSLTTNSHSFGAVTNGTNVVFGLEITNNSNKAATLSFSSTGSTQFTYSTSPCPNPLPAGQSCQMGIIFAPTATGQVSAYLTLSSNVQILPGGTGSGSSYSDVLTFTGTGAAAGSLTATSAGHNYGSIKVGSEATSYGVELSNNTAVALTLSMGGGTFGSNGAADGFTEQTNCPAVLPVNGNCEVVFTFTPTTVGTMQVMFPVAATNGSTSYPMAAGGNTYTGITLTGTGD